MSVYYEFNRFYAEKYFGGCTNVVQHHKTVNYKLYWFAKRIWEETDDGIRYIKHRQADPNCFPKVDMKEFMWIKLKSRQC